MRTFATALLVASAALVARPAAAATVSGGGPAASDCYAGFTVTSDNPGFTSDSKNATANACNNSCTFSVEACVGLTDVAGCTAQALSNLTGGAGLNLPTGRGPEASCGGATSVNVPLKRNGKKKGKKKYKMKARASAGKPKNDIDKLNLTCLPNPNSTGCDGNNTGTCPANSAGGPNRLKLTIGPSGTDLDNGWTGSSHNFILVPNGVVDGCLTECDSASDPECTFNAAIGEGTRNGVSFGAPLPLLASNVPVCVVSDWAQPVDGTANEATGDVSINVHLTSHVYLTDTTQVCPQCRNNTCQGGARNGQSCTEDARVPVFISQGNIEEYRLSASCIPSGAPAASLAINFVPLTTGTAAPLVGPIPCTNQPGEPPGVGEQPDACGGSGCGSQCTGLACVSTIDDPVNPGTQVCVDSKGGVSQLCCNNQTNKPCFTLANGGTVNRAGNPGVPQPALPDTTYPKTATAGVLASTFCIPATGRSSIDQVTGLPGPGAIQLTGPAEWSKE